MPSTFGKNLTECILLRCTCFKLSAHITSLCGGLVVAVLAYLSLTRLNVLSMDSQRWGLHGHQRALVVLAVIAVVLGSASALAAVLGCVDTLLARRPHRALDVVAAILILAQIGAGSAGFTLMTWVRNDIPQRRTNCKDCLRNIIFVCNNLLPVIGCLLLVSALAQAIAIVSNRVGKPRAELQAKLDRANQLEEYKMRTMNDFIDKLVPAKSHSWGGDLNLGYSGGTLFDEARAARQSGGATSAPRMKLRFGGTKTQPSRIRPPIEIVITEAPPDANSRAAAAAAFQRNSMGEGKTLALPDFSHYANVE
ncbi:uncharacterized protein LOC144173377 [Haemaphysalis longicornis]